MLLIEFVLSLLLTLLLEGVVALLWKFRGRNLLLFVLVNVLTNPVAVLLHNLFPLRYVTVLVETYAILTEGFCYARLGNKIRKPWLFSLTANLFSFWIGVLINIWIA